MDKLHLLETAHGTRYWRYNDSDSDDSRGEDHFASLDIIEANDADSIGQLWIDSASIVDICDAIGLTEQTSEARHNEQVLDLMYA